MKPAHTIDSFCLTKIENGYLLRYGSTEWITIFDYGFSIQHLTGFIEFKRKDELIFKEIPVYRLSQESVISIINDELPEWKIIRFDFTTDNYRVMEFYAGDCYISFTKREEIILYLSLLVINPVNPDDLYNLLNQDLGTIINILNDIPYVESKWDTTENFTIEENCPF